MESKVYVIGNGNSRQSIDLNSLSDTTYGCNAVYRDYSPDVLVTVDNGMMHEIYCNYTGNAKIYFREWNPLPAMMREAFPTVEPIIENERNNAEEFTLNGSAWATHITWLNRNIFPSVINIPDIADWSTGTTAIRLALENENPSEIVLIGFDLGSDTDYVNNVYAGTKNYLPENATAEIAYNRMNSAENWRGQHYRNFEMFPDVNFTIIGKEWKWCECENVRWQQQI